jgi:hypothetical protein
MAYQAVDVSIFRSSDKKLVVVDVIGRLVYDNYYIDVLKQEDNYLNELLRLT